MFYMFQKDRISSFLSVNPWYTIMTIKRIFAITNFYSTNRKKNFIIKFANEKVKKRKIEKLIIFL